MNDMTDHTPSVSIERQREMWRSVSSMEGYFRALISEYPKAVDQGRLDKWAAAAHSFIDLMALPPETEK